MNKLMGRENLTDQRDRTNIHMMTCTYAQHDYVYEPFAWENIRNNTETRSSLVSFQLKSERSLENSVIIFNVQVR